MNRKKSGIEKWGAVDLGEVRGVPGRRIVQLDDLVMILGSRIEPAHGSDPYFVLVNYRLDSPALDRRAAFSALVLAGQEAGIEVQGGLLPREGGQGSAFLAVPYHLLPEEALEELRRRRVPMSLEVQQPAERPRRRAQTWKGLLHS